MLLANEIRPPEIKRDPLSKVADFEIQGWRDHVHFKISGLLPMVPCGSPDETTETMMLKRLLLDIANTL